MKNGNERNWLVGILVFIFLVANALLFSVMKELENNPFSIFIVIFSLCADLFLIGFMIKIIAESISKNKSHQINENNHQDNTNDSYNNSFNNLSSLNNKEKISLSAPEEHPTIEINVTANSQPLNTNNDSSDILEKTNAISKEETNRLDTKSEFDIELKQNTEESNLLTTTEKSTYQSLYNALLALYNQRCEKLYSTLIKLQNKEKYNLQHQTHNIDEFERSTDVHTIQTPYTKKGKPMSDFNEETSFSKTDIENTIPCIDEKNIDANCNSKLQ